jgi:hypothetical protein
VDDDERIYLELVRRAPRPNDTQMRAFIRFVSDDHSWYKHLPVKGEGEPFFLYLRPHAHELLITDPSGAPAWRSIVSVTRTGAAFDWDEFFIERLPGDAGSDKPLITYQVSNTTTARWRERFGLWSYWNHGKPDQPRHEAIAMAEHHLRFYDDDGVERPVPTAVLEAGLVYLRATVSPLFFDDGDSAAERIELGLPPADEDQASQYTEMLQAMRRVVAAVYDGP